MNSRVIRNRVVSGARKNSRVLVLVLFVTATICSYAAHMGDRPITATLVYLIGVMMIGALRGLRAGLIAAIAASFIYSGLIRNPGLINNDVSLEFYVPLFGFNFAALLSGTLAGRLKDRAEIAEETQRQLDLLLEFSSKLQKAVRTEDVAQALRTTVSRDIITYHLIPYLEENVLKPRRDALQRVLELALSAPADTGTAYHHLAVQDIDLPAFIDLISIAVDRCRLLVEQSESQAKQRSEDLKTTILSSLSHDLRTPIAAISASAAGLRQFGDSLTPDVRAEMLQTIEHQCERLDQFTAKLLSFGRLQGGVAALQFEPADVAELLGKALATARASGPDHVIRKQWPEAPAIVIANPAMLEQVFFNILENAFVYTAPGCEIAVIVNVENERAEVVIRDSGRGVLPESLGHIFEPFFRSGQSKHTHGQGLGLFIAKGFIDAFGGTIEARSPHSDGPGLEIAISLPLADQKVEVEFDG